MVQPKRAFSNEWKRYSACIIPLDWADARMYLFRDSDTDRCLTSLQYIFWQE